MLLGIGKATVGRALFEFETKGFIQMTALGRWYGRTATIYAVTEQQVGIRAATNLWPACGTSAPLPDWA